MTRTGGDTAPSSTGHNAAAEKELRTHQTSGRDPAPSSLHALAPARR